MVVKDKFRDWNLYHKSVVIGIGACILWVIIWSVMVIDGAFEFEREEVLPYGPDGIWPVVIGDEHRPRWTTELVDVGMLTGEAGEADTTRLLFWRRRFKRWQAVERVTDVLPQRFIKYAQESDIDKRWLTVELVPTGSCETRVRIKEVIYPLEYTVRFWFFRESEAAEKRLEESQRALNRWVTDTAPACAAS